MPAGFGINNNSLLMAGSIDSTINKLILNAKSTNPSTNSVSVGGVYACPTKTLLSTNERDKQVEDNLTYYYEYIALLNTRLQALMTKLTNAYSVDLDYSMSNTTVFNRPAMMGNTSGNLVDAGAARTTQVYYGLWGTASGASTTGTDVSLVQTISFNGTNVTTGTTSFQNQNNNVILDYLVLPPGETPWYAVPKTSASTKVDSNYLGISYKDSYFAINGPGYFLLGDLTSADFSNSDPYGIFGIWSLPGGLPINRAYLTTDGDFRWGVHPNDPHRRTILLDKNGLVVMADHGDNNQAVGILPKALFDRTSPPTFYRGRPSIYRPADENTLQVSSKYTSYFEPTIANISQVVDGSANQLTSSDRQTTLIEVPNAKNKFEAVLWSAMQNPQYRDIVRFGLFKDIIIAATSNLPSGAQVQGTLTLNFNLREWRISITSNRWNAFYHS